MARVNPFDDLSDFAPASEPKPVEPAAIERIAQEQGFPSRAAATPAASTPPRAAPRRYLTGRNQQLNVKATAETVARFYRMADERRCPLGELFEEALLALEREVQRGRAALRRDETP